jgi:hypothetical protein
MKKYITVAIIGLALLGGTAATVVLDTEATMADGCTGSGC